jgi:hypothetical protein
MRCTLTIAMLAVFAVGCVTTTTDTTGHYVQPAAPSGPVSVATADEAIQNIKGYEYGESREPLTVVEDLVRYSMKASGQGDGLAGDLAALLSDPEATMACKQFVCRQLALIGTEANVTAIAPLLGNADTAHMARYALQPIPGDSVDVALINALPRSSGVTKAGIINTLGYRGSALAAPALTPLAADGDPLIAEAAQSALVKIKKN